MNSLELPYGNHPLVIAAPDHTVVVSMPAPEPGGPLAPLLERALDHPIGAAPLGPVGRALIVVSDGSRAEPREPMLAAVLARLGDTDITLAIANGTHRPAGVDVLGLPEALLERARIIDHDADDDGALVDLGFTRRGTPLRVNRCVLEADAIIALGRIKPHYFAGYGAGAKALFPGLGGNREVRINHQLKTHPDSRPGVVDGNPCREDLEEIVDVLPVRPFLLNVVLDAGGGARAAVAGDVRGAFRRGAALAAPLFEVEVPMADCLVVSDRLPLTGSLYQASKLVAAVAPRLRPGGAIVLAAECPEGTGPVEVVNRAIYDIGLRPRLPADHTVFLVSGLSAGEVEPTYCTYAPSVESVLERYANGAVVVFPRAGDAIVRAGA